MMIAWFLGTGPKANGSLSQNTSFLCSRTANSGPVIFMGGDDMARRPFYDSAAWQRCRDGYIASVFGLCERCGRPGYIVHHKQPITDANVDDPEITLNWDNLEYLCLECHNREHFGTEPTREDVRFDASGQLIKA